MYRLEYSNNPQAGWYARIYSDETGEQELVCECFDSANVQMILALLNDAQG